MTEHNQSKLEFSIEESVWLNKGQEVEELYTVDLNPEVTIEEVDDQICIKGYLCLTGEYRCADQTEEETASEESTFLGYRSFSQLNEVSDDVVKLDHRFPVDITLPKNRVLDKDELLVTVDDFNYEMPTPSCIEVFAAVSVSGVYENHGYVSEEFENQESVYENDDVYETREEDDEDDHELYEGGSNPFPILEFEARRSPEPDEHEEEMEYKAERREPQVEFLSRSEERYDYSDAYGHLSDLRNSDTSDYEEEYEEEEEPYRPDEYEYEENDEEYDYEEEIEENDDHEEVEGSSHRPPREENALYLTKMLTRDDEELTKMKMCIIQAGDSLDSIAGRYDIPASQLMRVNRLESEEIEEGQILYIPVSVR